MSKKKVILFMPVLHKIGGVETFCVNFCKRLNQYIDLTFMFVEADPSLVLTIADHCAVQKLEPRRRYKCDTLVLATAWGLNPEYIISSERQVQTVHGDYAYYIGGWNFTYKRGDKTTHHMAVSNHVKNSFELVTPHKIDSVIYNLLAPDYKAEPKTTRARNQLRLITCSRISKEKGFDRLIKMVKMLVSSKINFTWDIYGSVNSLYGKDVIKKLSPYKQVQFKGFTYTPQLFINQSDYLVQLSDTEGCPYSILESLQTRTPVICTHFPSAVELIDDGVNGYLFNMDLSDMDFNKIKNIPKLPEYTEKSTVQDWLDLL